MAPENQQALEQIRKKYNLTDLTNSIRLYQNADLLKGAPDAKNFGFKDSNDAEFSFRGGYVIRHMATHIHHTFVTQHAWAQAHIGIMPVNARTTYMHPCFTPH